VGPDSYIIDFVIANPASKTYNKYGIRAEKKVNCAALIAKKLKREQYATVYPPIDPSRIIPFAIEATGRLGPVEQPQRWANLYILTYIGWPDAGGLHIGT
jgi:hypothetical protein